MLPFWITDSLSPTTALCRNADAGGGSDRRRLAGAARDRLNVQDSLRREQAADDSLRFGGVWTTVIVVQVAITVALLPLAPVLVMASNRFRQRAEGRRRGQLPAGRRDLRAPGTGDRSGRSRSQRAPRAWLNSKRRLRAEPGVEQVAFADRLPVDGHVQVQRRGRTAAGAPATGLRASTLVHVSSGFFAAFGARSSPAGISRRRTSNAATS